MLSFLCIADSRISEEEEDYDYSPDEDEWKKINKVGQVTCHLHTTE